MNQLVTQNNSLGLAGVPKEHIQLLKEQICPGASDLELEYFLTVAKRTGLDWSQKQIFGIMRRSKVKGTDQWESKITIQIGIDGLRLIAERSKKYEGQTEPEFYENGKWVQVPTTSKPLACRVGVYKTGFKMPLYGVVYWAEVAQETNFWQRMPLTMLAKTAEAQAIRKAFPNETAVISEESLHKQEEVEARVYEALPHQKRFLLNELQKQVPNLDVQTDKLKIIEVSNLCVGCPIDEIPEKIAELLSDTAGDDVPY